MSYIDGIEANKWIKNNHPENGLFRVYWKNVVNWDEGGATFDPDEGEGLRWEWYYKDGERADGISRGWFPNSNLKSEHTWKDGKLNGKWIQWKETGEKEIVKYYKDGNHDGSYIEWYKNGEKLKEGTYKDGNYDGLWTYWYINGQKRWEKTFKLGEIISEINYNKDGQITGSTVYGFK